MPTLFIFSSTKPVHKSCVIVKAQPRTASQTGRTSATPALVCKDGTRPCCGGIFQTAQATLQIGANPWYSYFAYIDIAYTRAQKSSQCNLSSRESPNRTPVRGNHCEPSAPFRRLD